jgi:hypothetical protein
MAVFKKSGAGAAPAPREGTKGTPMGDLRVASIPGSPSWIVRSFEKMSAFKSWVLVASLGLNFLLVIEGIRLAGRPPEFVLVDADTGDATMVKRSVATTALLAFIAEKTRPPEAAVLHFTQKFLHLMLAVNSSTIDTAWPAALDMTAPSLRKKLEAEASQQKLVETYKIAQRKTDIVFEDVRLVDRERGLLAIRATMRRRVAPLLETGNGPSVEDRIQVDLVEEIVAPTFEHPEGLRVREWRLGKIEGIGAAATSATTLPSSVNAPAHP